MPATPAVIQSFDMNGNADNAATQVSVKLSTQLPEPFKVPEDALVTLVEIHSQRSSTATTFLICTVRAPDCPS